MSNYLRILVFRPGQGPQEMLIPNTLAAKQAVVGGYIETFSFGLKDLVLVINDNAWHPSVSLNRTVNQMPIAGTFFAARINMDTGEFSSLRRRDMMTLLKKDATWSHREMNQVE